MSGESPLSMMHAGRRRMAPRRRRRGFWSIAAPVAVVVVLAAAWCGLWYLSASTADRTLTGWVQREAAAGRVYSCGSQGISGFPFRIVVRCIGAAARLDSIEPPLAVAAKAVTFTAQVYHPTLLVGNVSGPLTIAAPGQQPRVAATWSFARMSVSGLPPNPDSVAVSILQPRLDDFIGGKSATLIAAGDAELRARIIDGSAGNHPVIDAVVQMTSATAPTVHALLAEPLQGDIEIVVRGLRDLSPKPMSARFREMQAAGGDIEIKSLRIARSDATVIGTGTLTVNEHGRLDGTLAIAISGIENIVPQLGIDKLIGKGIDRLTSASGQAGQGLAALDRLVPGLSGVVRQTTNASIVDDLKKMGQPTAIDGKPATSLPLRFADGAIYLGMVRIGEVPALF